jgi:hypothetical protein
MQRRSFRALAGALAAASILCLFGLPRRAAADGACDWLRPDTDMRQLFPEADDYHPVYKRPFEQRERIEARLGYKLWGWENLIRYYTIMKGDRRVGTIYVHLTPDNTQVVVGITNEGAVKGVLLQRYYGGHREEFSSPRFLGQFRGKTLADPFTIGKDIKPACPELEGVSSGLALTVRKLLVFYSIYG